MDLLKGAGDGGVDLTGHAFVAVVKGHVQPGVREDDTITLRHGKPVDVHAHIVEELTDLQPFALLADGHHLMQGGFDLDAVADEVRCEAARKVVLLQDQNILDALGL